MNLFHMYIYGIYVLFTWRILTNVYFGTQNSFREQNFKNEFSALVLGLFNWLSNLIIESNDYISRSEESTDP